MTEPADTSSARNTSPFEFRVEVPFGPHWQHVELLRMSILHCLATLFQSRDFCEQLGKVTAELVENAIHYGDWTGEDQRPFRVAVRGDGGDVIVEVSNPINLATVNVKRLENIVSQLANATTPKEAYVARLREIADRPEEGGSGLGLLRVAYETGCHLEFRVDGATACVMARIQGDTRT